MGPAMENVMKTPSRWRSANREDEKAVAAAEIIMENIQSAPPTPHRLRLSRPQVSAFRRRTDVFHLLLQDGGAWQCREAVG